MNASSIEVAIQATGAAETESAINRVTASGLRAGQATDAWTASQVQLQARLDAVAVSISGVDAANARAVSILMDRIAAEQALAAIIQAQPAQLAQLTAMTATLAAAQRDAAASATTMAASHQSAGAAMGMSGMQASMLRMRFSQLVGQALGVNGAVVGLTGAFGSMAIGSVAVIGLMAGVAAIAYAYEKLSLSLKGVTADQEKAIEAFEKAQRLKEAGGKSGVANTGLQAEIAKRQVEIDDLKAQIASAGPINPPGLTSPNAMLLAGGAEPSVATLQASVDKLKKVLDQKVHDQADAQAELLAQQGKADESNRAHYAADLAELVKSGIATDKVRNQALALEKNYFAAAKIMQDQGNYAAAADFAKMAETISAAFTKSDKLPAAVTQMQKFRDEFALMQSALAESGKDASIDTKIGGIVNALERLKTEPKADVVEINALEDSFRSLGEKMKAADLSKVAADIDAQHDAQVKLTAAVVAGGGAVQDATAANRADAEIKRLQISLGAPLSQALQDEIRDTERLRDIQKDETGTKAILDQAAAMKIENDSMKLSNESRAAYVINKKADLDITQALLISDNNERNARLAAIEALRQQQLAHVELEAAQTAQTNAAKAGLKDEEQAVKLFTQGLRQDFTQAIEDISKSGKGTFDSLFSAIKTGFAKLIADIAAISVAKPLASALGLDDLLSSVKNAGTSGLPAGIGAPTPMAGMLTTAAIGVFVGGMLAIGSSIMQTSELNAQAVRQYADANVKWQASFQNLVNSFANTNFEKARASLAAQFQSLADSAITSAQTAIQNSPAARFGASGVGAFGSTTGTIPGALGSMSDLDAYIANLQRAQGTGANVNGDRELATLLAQLQQLDAAYKVQAQAAADDQKAQEAAYNSDLNVRTLRAQGLTTEADTLQLFNQQVAEFAAAVKAGYDQTTLSELANTQALEREAQAQTQAAAAAQTVADAQTKAAAATQAAIAAVAKNVSDAAALWEKIGTDFKTFTQNMADSSTSLSIRMLKATGDMTGAAALAFQLQQSQEMNQAQAAVSQLQLQQAQAQAALAVQNTTHTGATVVPVPNGAGGTAWILQDPLADAMKGQVASIQTEIQAQQDYMKQLGVVQAAEAAANAANPGGTSLAAATAAAAGTAGSFGTVVSVATAHQADTMVGELVAQTVLLQDIATSARALRDFGGAVDRALGARHRNAVALAGGGTVT